MANMSGNGTIVRSAFLLFAFLGLVNAVFLVREHYSKATPSFCPTGGCETVLSSKYSSIGGVPLALLGTFHYLILFVVSIAIYRGSGAKLSHFVVFDTAAGAVFSVYLVFLQVFVLHAICLYCMISAGISFVLPVFGILMLRQNRILSLATVTDKIDA